MKTHPQEILVIYDASSSQARRTIAYAHTISRHVREWEYHKTPLTTTMWNTLLQKLNIEAKQLFDKSQPYYQQFLRGRLYDDEGWLNIIRRNPQLIKAPIVVYGNKAILCTNPTQIFSLLQQESGIEKIKVE